MNRIFTLILFFVISNCVAQDEKHGQTSRIDDLKVVFYDESQSLDIRDSALHGLASQYFKTDLDSAKFFIDKGEDFTENIKELEDSRKVLLIKYNYAKGDNKAALEISREMLNRGKEDILELNTKRDLYSMTASVLRDLGLNKEALSYSYQALDMLKKLDKRRHRDEIVENFNIGNIFADLSDWEKSDSQYQVALKLIDSIKAEEFRPPVMNSIGVNFLDQKKYDKAILTFEELINISNSSGNIVMKATALNNLGLCRIYKGEYEEAEQAFRNAMIYFKETGDEGGITDVISDQAHLYFLQGKYTEAKAASKKALKRNIADNYLVGQLGDVLNLYQTNKKLGNYQEALKYHEDWRALKDSMYSAKKAREFTQTELEYEFKNEQEITEIRNQEAQKTLRAEASANRNLAGGIAALALAFLGFFWNARRKNKIIAEANNQLESLNHTKDRIFAIIGHDLRKPVIGFRGISKVINYLLDNKDYDRLQKVGTEVERDALSLYKLTDNLLSWALMQKDVMPYNPSQVSAAEIAAETMTVFQRVASDKNITLTSKIPADLTVFADPNALATIVRNLTDNALKYTPEGGSVTLNAVESATSVKIIVEDTGIGIAKDKINDIFLLQKDKSERGTAGEKGTGIGLHLIHELVKLNQGEVEVESALGKGTKVVVMLPKRAVAMAA